MRVMIIGSGGYLGSRLAAEMRRRDHDVIAVSSRNRGGIDPRTGALPADFAVPPGVETVYFLSAAPVDGITRMFNVNVASAVGAAEAARRAGVARFVYTSTGNVYAPGFTPRAEDASLRRDLWYPLTKVHAEEALALFRDGMEVTLARLFGIYGPGQERRMIPNLIETIRSGGSVVIEPHPCDPADRGGLRISLCYVDDAVRILCALADPGRPPVLNVASDVAMSIRELALAIGRALDREPRFELAGAARLTDLIADVSLLRRTLAPEFTPFAAGLRATLEHSPG